MPIPSRVFAFLKETAVDHDAVLLTGGSEAPLVAPVVAGFNSSGTLSKRNDDPAGASRPFDAGRDGFVTSEGAAILVLEELEFARARGARILAEFLGYGSSADAYHISAPAEDGSGAAKAMSAALEDAGLKPGASVPVIKTLSSVPTPFT